MKHLQEIYNALGRLSNLNQSLLLLTKIENNQFIGSAAISLDNLIKEKLEQFEELLENKKIIITTDLETTTIHCNEQLADILINNLLTNAIRYNLQNGSISIRLSGNALHISNSSFLPPLDHDKVFHRFYRHTATKQDGNGLGLSIVKQICDIAGYSITYRYNNDLHEFIVQF